MLQEFRFLNFPTPETPSKSFLLHGVWTTIHAPCHGFSHDDFRSTRWCTVTSDTWIEKWQKPGNCMQKECQWFIITDSFWAIDLTPWSCHFISLRDARGVMRDAENGGQPCTGETTQGAQGGLNGRWVHSGVTCRGFWNYCTNCQNWMYPQNDVNIHGNGNSIDWCCSNSPQKSFQKYFWTL